MRTYVWLSTILLALAACNTVEGFGKDMEKGGQAIQRTADK